MKNLTKGLCLFAILGSLVLATGGTIFNKKNEKVINENYQENKDSQEKLDEKEQFLENYTQSEDVKQMTRSRNENCVSENKKFGNLVEKVLESDSIENREEEKVYNVDSGAAKTRYRTVLNIKYYYKGKVSYLNGRNQNDNDLTLEEKSSNNVATSSRQNRDNDLGSGGETSNNAVPQKKTPPPPESLFPGQLPKHFGPDGSRGEISNSETDDDLDDLSLDLEIPDSNNKIGRSVKLNKQRYDLNDEESDSDESEPLDFEEEEDIPDLADRDVDLRSEDDEEHSQEEEQEQEREEQSKDHNGGNVDVPPKDPNDNDDSDRLQPLDFEEEEDVEENIPDPNNATDRGVNLEDETSAEKKDSKKTEPSNNVKSPKDPNGGSVKISKKSPPDDNNDEGRDPEEEDIPDSNNATGQRAFRITYESLDQLFRWIDIQLQKMRFIQQGRYWELIEDLRTLIRNIDRTGLNESGEVFVIILPGKIEVIQDGEVKIKIKVKLQPHSSGCGISPEEEDVEEDIPDLIDRGVDLSSEDDEGHSQEEEREQEKEELSKENKDKNQEKLEKVEKLENRKENNRKPSIWQMLVMGDLSDLNEADSLCSSLSLEWSGSINSSSQIEKNCLSKAEETFKEEEELEDDIPNSNSEKNRDVNLEEEETNDLVDEENAPEQKQGDEGKKSSVSNIRKSLDAGSNQSIVKADVGSTRRMGIQKQEGGKIESQRIFKVECSSREQLSKAINSIIQGLSNQLGEALRQQLGDLSELLRNVDLSNFNQSGEITVRLLQNGMEVIQNGEVRIKFGLAPGGDAIQQGIKSTKLKAIKYECNHQIERNRFSKAEKQQSTPNEKEKILELLDRCMKLEKEEISNNDKHQPKDLGGSDEEISNSELEDNLVDLEIFGSSNGIDRGVKLEKEKYDLRDSKIDSEEERPEQERIQKEKEEQERHQKEKEEQERLEQEKIQKEKAEQERLEKERLEQERLEQERIQKEKEEQERLEQERLEQERLEQERLEQERLEQERLEQERLKQERLEQERLEQERIQKEKERLENDQQSSNESNAGPVEHKLVPVLTPVLAQRNAPNQENKENTETSEEKKKEETCKEMSNVNSEKVNKNENQKSDENYIFAPYPEGFLFEPTEQLNIDLSKQESDDNVQPKKQNVPLVPEKEKVQISKNHQHANNENDPKLGKQESASVLPPVPEQINVTNKENKEKGKISKEKKKEETSKEMSNVKVNQNEGYFMFDPYPQDILLAPTDQQNIIGSSKQGPDDNVQPKKQDVPLVPETERIQISKNDQQSNNLSNPKSAGQELVPMSELASVSARINDQNEESKEKEKTSEKEKKNENNDRGSSIFGRIGNLFSSWIPGHGNNNQSKSAQTNESEFSVDKKCDNSDVKEEREKKESKVDKEGRGNKLEGFNSVKKVKRQRILYKKNTHEDKLETLTKEKEEEENSQNEYSASSDESSDESESFVDKESDNSYAEEEYEEEEDSSDEENKVDKNNSNEFNLIKKMALRRALCRKIVCKKLAEKKNKKDLQNEYSDSSDESSDESEFSVDKESDNSYVEEEFEEEEGKEKKKKGSQNKYSASSDESSDESESFVGKESEDSRAEEEENRDFDFEPY